MLSSSGLWGMMATGMVLLWGSVAIAQPSGPPNERPTTSAASVPPSLRVSNSLICDSSGEICIVASKPTIGPIRAVRSAPSAALPTPVRSATVAHVSPSAIATPGLLPRKQQSLTIAPRPLICDASGKICTSVSGQPAGASIAKQSAPRSSAPALARSSPKTNASGPPVTELSSIDRAAQIQIDGIGAYDDTAGLITEDPFDWVVHAYKAQHRLEVYFKGHLYKTYHAVFGRNLTAGAKLWQGDRRTPEGNYLIVGKHRSARFGWFLHINYPNDRDHQRFEQSRAAHLIPARANEGGQIGIHGTDSPYLNVADVNWTTGCISVDNADIGELARLLPVGTLVIINP
jgi:lipoprotein-anchoring transpeptidase ErfK/SrfK